MAKQSRFLGALAMALVALGCGKGNLVPVKGVVTLDGQPLEGASVTFVPEENGGFPAGGRTDANGAFHLSTYSDGDGARLGDYRVTVTKAANDPSWGDKRQMMKKRVAGKGTEPRNLLPAVYAAPSKTPFRSHVPTAGKITLELTGKGPSSP